MPWKHVSAASAFLSTTQLQAAAAHLRGPPGLLMHLIAPRPGLTSAPAQSLFQRRLMLHHQKACPLLSMPLNQSSICHLTCNSFVKLAQVWISQVCVFFQELDPLLEEFAAPAEAHARGN